MQHRWITGSMIVGLVAAAAMAYFEVQAGHVLNTVLFVICAGAFLVGAIQVETGNYD